MYNENPILCRGCAFMMHVTFGTPFHSSTHPGTRARHLHARAATLQRSSVQRILLSMPLLLFLGGCGTSEGQTTPGVRSTVPSSTEPTADMQDRLPPPGHAWVIFGTDTVTAEVARTPEEREQGLMYRESLADGRGMLFVFPDSQVRSFWMKNTFIPLDIGYMDANLQIVDIQAMQPESEETHTSAAPAMFALEVPLGWFEKEGIGVGAEAQLVFGPG